ncbi:MAG: hypothetical protein AAGI08_17770 [Bacteroidota bacterium]
MTDQRKPWLRVAALVALALVVSVQAQPADEPDTFHFSLGATAGQLGYNVESIYPPGISIGFSGRHHLGRGRSYSVHARYAAPAFREDIEVYSDYPPRTLIQNPGRLHRAEIEGRGMAAFTLRGRPVSERTVSFFAGAGLAHTLRVDPVFATGRQAGRITSQGTVRRGKGHTFQPFASAGLSVPVVPRLLDLELGASLDFRSSSPYKSDALRTLFVRATTTL